MPSMPPKDTSMLDWNRNTIKIRKIRHYFFVLTNSKPDPYLGLKDHTASWTNTSALSSRCDGVSATMLTMPLRCGYVHEDLAAM